MPKPKRQRFLQVSVADLEGLLEVTEGIIDDRLVAKDFADLRATMYDRANELLEILRPYRKYLPNPRL